MAELLRVTADGAVTTKPVILYTVVLTGVGAAATVAVKASASGTTYATIKAASDATTSVSFDGAQLPGGLYLDLTGTNAEVAVEYLHS